jgi:hypothetical protein
MDRKKSMLAETMILFLFALSKTSEEVNINTYKRYIYLYYLTSGFINNNSDDIEIIVEKGDIKIIEFESIISDFVLKEYIETEKNSIIIKKKLLDFVDALLRNKDGALIRRYKEIQPFVSLIQSYNDQFVFTVFFSEPTFREAPLRGVSEIHSANSKLAVLLKQFKSKVCDTRIDEYDILAYWMDYILRNYYNIGADGDAVEE